MLPFVFVHDLGDTEQQRQLCDLLHIWRQIQKVLTTILGKNHSLSSFDFNLLTFVLLPHILSSSFLVLTISSPTESSPTFSSQCWVSESPLPLTKTFFSTDLARSIRPSVDPIELWKGRTKMQLGLDLTKIVDKEKFTTTKSCFRIIVCYFC